MSTKILTNYDFSDGQLLNALLMLLASNPSNVEGKIYYNSAAKEIRFFNGSSWIALGPAGAGGPPTGAASGDLTGSYPGPTIAALAVTDAKVAAANKDGAAGTPSMRTLGTGAQQAAAGNDARFTDARPPTGSAGGDLTGTYPNPQIAAGSIVDADVNAANKDGLATTPSMRTLSFTSTTAMPGNARLDQIAAPTTFVSFNNQLVRNVANPAAGTDAANKDYVDLVTQGFTFKNAVRLVTTTNVGQSGLAAIDGVTPVANDRILCTAQTTATQNGIWLAQSGSWTRATDMDATGELVDGTLVPVGSGTTYADSLWLCTAVSATPWVPASSTSTWTKFLSITDLVAGAGMTKTGNTLDVVSATADMTVAADSITINSAPKWTTGRTIALTGDVTGTSAAFDGTGNLSIATTLVGGTAFPKQYAGDVPASSGGMSAITHNLNTRDVSVTIYRNSTPWDTVICDVERPTVNQVNLRFNTDVSAAAYRVVVQGK